MRSGGWWGRLTCAGTSYLRADRASDSFPRRATCSAEIRPVLLRSRQVTGVFGACCWGTNHNFSPKLSGTEKPATQVLPRVPAYAPPGTRTPHRLIKSQLLEVYTLRAAKLSQALVSFGDRRSVVRVSDPEIPPASESLGRVLGCQGEAGPSGQVAAVIVYTTSLLPPEVTVTTPGTSASNVSVAPSKSTSTTKPRL